MNVADAVRDEEFDTARQRPLAVGGAVRVAFVIFGAMLVLQSSEVLDLTKVAYLAGGALCLIGALGALWYRRRASSVVGLALPWLVASGALVALVVLSFGVARANGTPIIDWLRDVAAYALFASVPIFALDAQSALPRRVMIAMLVAVGLLGGLSWSVEWLDRRNIIDLPIGRLLFPSAHVPAMLYIFAAASALAARRRRIMWTLLAGVTLALFLMTGTRSSLLLLTAPLGMGILLGWARRRSSAVTLVSHGVVAAGLVVLFQFAVTLPVAPPPGTDPASTAPAGAPAPGALGDRFGSIPDLVEQPGSDPSMRERVAQYRSAWALFVSSPLIGVGPGHPIEWTNVSGQLERGFVADTPLVMPAKLGIVGVAVFIAVGVAYWRTVRASLSRRRHSPVTLALIGYGIWVVATLPLGFFVEDKGASLALILLLGLAYEQLAVAPGSAASWHGSGRTSGTDPPNPSR
jgi:O-antigen ligase